MHQTGFNVEYSDYWLRWLLLTHPTILHASNRIQCGIQWLLTKMAASHPSHTHTNNFLAIYSSQWPYIHHNKIPILSFYSMDKKTLVRGQALVRGQVPSTKRNMSQVQAREAASPKIRDKAAYHDLSQTPQKWKFCALGMTFFFNK